MISGSQLGEMMKEAFHEYIGAVREGRFPAEEHTYKIDDEIIKKLY